MEARKYKKQEGSLELFSLRREAQARDPAVGGPATGFLLAIPIELS